MKNQSFILITLLFAMLLLAGCDEAATQPPATKVPPTQAPPPTALAPATQVPASQEVPTGELNAATVLNMVECLNAGDVEGSLAFFAEDAMAYLMGFPPTGIEMYKGKEQIRSLWQDSVDNHFEWEVEVTSTDGDLVMGTIPLQGGSQSPPSNARSGTDRTSARSAPARMSRCRGR